MITDLKPYPAMKHSGLPWLGEVPEHWSLVPNKVMLRRRKTLVGQRHTEYQLLSLTKSGVIVRDVSTSRGKFSADMGTSQEVRCGDLIFCLFDVPETPRTIGLSDHDGMITGAYDVFECEDMVLTRFLEAFYIAMDDRKLLSPLYLGLRNTIPTSRFLGVKTPVPPPAEQAAIVRYLDHADDLINRYISAKERLIALLEEQRKAVIHQAITRGLNQNAQTSPCTIPLLDQIPSHWKTMRLRNVADVRFSNVDKHIRDGEERVKLCNYVDVYSHDFITDDIPFMKATATPEEISRFRLQVGDVLITKDSETWDDIGVPAIVVFQQPNLVCGYHIALLRPQPNTLNGRYLFRVLQDATIAYQSHVGANGVTRFGLPQECIKSIEIPTPPLEEQQAIADFLDERTASIKTKTTRCHNQIKLAQEYRTRLIADAVTGKIDVRNATIKLPE